MFAVRGRLKTQTTSRKGSLVLDNPDLFTTIAHYTNTSYEWLYDLEQELESYLEGSNQSDVTKSVNNASSDNVTDAFKGSDIHGPHAVDFFRREPPNPNYPDMVTIVVGEVHGNEEGCNGTSRTIFDILTYLVIHYNNFYLILESFFHLIPPTVEKAIKLSTKFRDLADKHKEHSMWKACECIKNGVTDVSCKVGRKPVGQLILFRAFSFIVQTTVVFLNSNNIRTSSFHKLNSRLHHMDLREDLDLTPYEWITEGDKNAQVVKMVSSAAKRLDDYIPTIHSEDLNNTYNKNVRKHLNEKIGVCLQNPNSETYTTVFVTITEFVTLAQHLSIMEKYRKDSPHVCIVAGDTHRVTVSDLLTNCLGKKIKLFKTLRASHSLSCMYTH